MIEPPPKSQKLDWEPLDLPEIEPKPKRVVLDDDFCVAIDLNERQQSDYVRVRGLIRSGGDLGAFYRRSRTADWLLRSRKVLHLHLGGPGSDAILYAVQYPSHILFIRIDTHIHLDDVPAGKRLPVRGRKRFQDELRRELEESAKKLAASKARLTSGKPKP